MEILLTYIGKRITTKNKLAHCYIDSSHKEYLFKRPLNKTQYIGDNLKCKVIDENKYSYIETTGQTDSKYITSWSIIERTNIEKFNEIKSRIKPDSHIDSLIKQIKINCGDYYSRKRIGIYILTELLK